MLCNLGAHNVLGGGGTNGKDPTRYYIENRTYSWGGGGAKVICSHSWGGRIDPDIIAERGGGVERDLLAAIHTGVLVVWLIKFC